MLILAFVLPTFGAHGAISFFLVLGAIWILWEAAYPWYKAAECPSCGEGIKEPTKRKKGERARCDHCHQYLQRISAEFELVDERTIEPKPAFQSLLPEEFRWPSQCCVCGGKVAGLREHSDTETQLGRNLLLGAAGLAAGAVVVRTGGGETISVRVPYCEDCKGGLRIRKIEGKHYVAFRSYSFYLRFCELNDLEGQPKPPQSFAESVLKPE